MVCPEYQQLNKVTKNYCWFFGQALAELELVINRVNYICAATANLASSAGVIVTALAPVNTSLGIVIAI